MIMKLFNNKFLYLIFSIFISIPIIAQEESINQIIEYGLKRAENQSLILAQELKNREHVLPRTYENNKLQTIHYDHWVSGIIKIRNLENMQNYIQHV